MSSYLPLFSHMCLGSKKKGVISEGEQDAGVALKPSVATESQSVSSSFTEQSFFRAELQAIKEKQG